MRGTYMGFYPPTIEESRSMWADGLIVPDANTLLNLYRYTVETREEFLQLLEFFGNRLWLPYQAGLEFQRHRVEVISQQLRAHDEVVHAIEKTQRDLEAELRRFTRHSTLNVDSLLARHGEATQKMTEEVLRRRAEHVENQYPASALEDPIWDAITRLFANRVGEQFDQNVLDQIFEDGAVRYEANIPPGFKDSAKAAPDRYGDLVIWKEILRRASEGPSAVIFVTDDRKEDWWRVEQGKTLGPRHELVTEFNAVTGRRVHFYTPDRFLEYARDMMSATVSERSIVEARTVGSSIRENSAVQAELRNLHETLLDELDFLDSYESRLPRADLESMRLELKRLEEQREELASIQSALFEAIDVESDPHESLFASINATRLQIEGLEREIARIRGALTSPMRAANDQHARRNELMRRLREVEERLIMLDSRGAERNRISHTRWSGDRP